MLYIPKIDDYLEILTDEEVKDFAVINFSKYSKSIKEEQNLRKVAKSLHIFLTTPAYFIYPDIQNTKPMIKNKLKVLKSLK